MNLHVFERTSTIALASFVAAGTGVAAATEEAQKLSPNEMFAVLAGFVVMLGGALTLAFVRWLNKVERNVPRSAKRDEAALAQILSTLHELDGKVDDINVRLGRVEGAIGLVVVKP